MTSESISKTLRSNILGRPVELLENTDSTNAQLKIKAENHTASQGFCLIAQQQNEGKGTDGNSWASAKGNIYASILFAYDDKVNTLFPLYPAVALCRVLRKYHIEAHVKWPNDVLIGKRKIAGILCEGASGKYMIMGIGINVNQETFAGELSNIATSLMIETGNEFALEEILANFLEEYEKLYYGHYDILKEWLKLTEMIGKTIATFQEGKEKKVKVMGLSPEGFLLVESEGKTETLMARRGLDISVDY